MAPVPEDFTSEIITEIRRVLERFGVEFTGQLDLTNPHAVNRCLESRGADIYLLCAIGSWKDTISDEEVLRDLREWLRAGEEALRPGPSFARINACS
jgi:sugar phosphate isomerase/epimerase